MGFEDGCPVSCMADPELDGEAGSSCDVAVDDDDDYLLRYWCTSVSLHTVVVWFYVPFHLPWHERRCLLAGAVSKS